MGNKKQGRHSKLHCLLILVLITGMAVPGTAEMPRQEAFDILQKTGSAFSAIAREAIPAVVFIQAERTIAVRAPAQQFFNNPFDVFGDDFLRRFFHGHGHDPRQRPRQQPERNLKQTGQGSGFIINEEGYILTNHHVVGDADRIIVKLHDGREFEAERIGTDDKSEIAVIRIQGEDLPHLRLGDSAAIEVGEWAVAVGNPFGLAATVTAGIISAKGRSGIGITDYENFIQTDAAINPGNSGGPLLNIHGEVIGINTAIFSRSGGYMGIGFAIPINMARAIKRQLVESGTVTRGYLGVYMQEITPALAESFGLEQVRGILVADVMKDSPAEAAGIQQDDVILQMNGKDTNHAGDFRNEIASNPPGTRLALTLLRAGKQKQVDVVTGSLDTPESEADELAARFGLAVQELTEELARQFNYETGAGVLVSDVERGTAAWRGGIRSGDLINAVNRHPVSDLDEFREALAPSEQTGTVLFRVRRGRGSRYVVLNIRE